jgi:hypothetical protein
MAQITATNRANPNKVVISGGDKFWDYADVPAGVAIVPGMGVELYDGTGLKFRPQSVAANEAPLAFAVERALFNADWKTAYAIGEVPRVYWARAGDVLYLPVISGITVAIGSNLQQNGDGYFKLSAAATATANVARLQALEALGLTSAITYCRVVVLC